jgi:L-threonylcarbamoyladenylate synthase
LQAFLINKAKTILSSDGVIGMPTETVYGLAADCTSDKAVQKVFALKGRPSHNPLIIHVSSLNQALKYGIFNEEALKLTHQFWPGPLTVVVPLQEAAGISSLVTAGLETIAIRCPNHPLALDLLNTYPNALAAPSANISGYVSPTQSEHVRSEFGESLYILESFSSEIGLESTIVDCSTAEVTVLRPGFVTQVDIEKCLGMTIGMATNTSFIKSPGQLLHHYAPKLPVRLNATHVDPEELALNFGESFLIGTRSLNLSPAASLQEAASNLFAYLRQLDTFGTLQNSLRIAVAPIPNEGVGIAINERLSRAAAVHQFLP